MPSYVIHLCIAKEYLKKNKIENEEEFIKGSIAPDRTTNKKLTHYANNNSIDTNLYKYLSAKSLNSSYEQGYFMHLLSDYLFYNKYFFGWKETNPREFYNDFDILNQPLIKKYDLKRIPEEIKNYTDVCKTGDTVEYHYDNVVEFVENVSKFNLSEVADEILSKKDYKFLLEKGE